MSCGERHAENNMKNRTRRAYFSLFVFMYIFLAGPGLTLPSPHAQQTQAPGDDTRDHNTRGNEEGFFYIEKTGERPRFIQHIVWEKSEYAYRYEVTIEKSGETGFLQTVKEFTSENFIEVSLSAGHYRYRVIVHDFFDIPGEASAWTEFEIRPALQPGISGFSPQTFWLDEDTVWVISLDGQNFIQESEIYLRPHSSDIVIIPAEYIPNPAGTGARLVFDRRALMPGLYDVYIKNPGGLEEIRGTFRIAFRRAFDLNLSIGYGPLVPLYGDLNTFFDKSIFPLGAAARISFLPFKEIWGSLGLELAPFCAYLSTSDADYELSAQYLGLHLNLLFQKWLESRTLALNFRLGAGFALLDDLHFEFSAGNTEPLRTLMRSLGAGLSIAWYINTSFFIEGGADYMHFFSVDPVSPGYLRPILGCGFRF
jgi:hypothetical protein